MRNNANPAVGDRGARQEFQFGKIEPALNSRNIPEQQIVCAGEGTLPTSATTSQPRDFRDYLLAELRCARLRARIMQADIEAVGIALKGDVITPDQALVLLDDCDALRIVGTESIST